MTQSLDLHISPINRQNNRDMESLPGLLATKSPRRAARGRSGELLLIHLFLKGTAPLSPKGYNKLLAHLAKLYFETPGSSTTAMGTLVSWLNRYLLERNRRGAERDMSAVGMMTLAVLRARRLNLAQCGSSQAILINASGMKDLSQAGSQDQGLGLVQKANVRYQLLDPSPGDIVLLTPESPPVWTKTLLMGLRGLEHRAAYRRLVDRVGPALQAAIIHLEVGSGDLHITPFHDLASDPLDKKVETSPGKSTASLHKAELQEKVGSTQSTSVSADLVDPAQEINDQAPVSAIKTGSREVASREISVSKPGNIAGANKTSTKKKRIVKKDQDLPPGADRRPWIVPAIQKIGKAIVLTLQRSWHFLSQMGKRMLPEETIPTISSSTMALFAVLVPILVVALAAMVYFRRGRGNLYEQYYTDALVAAESAIQLSDPGALRETWSTVLEHLDQAEQYLVTEDSRAMRDYAVKVLDDLDLVIRLPFQPALASRLPPDAIIHRIVTTEGDSIIYLLNQTNGHVYRGTIIGQGYIIDEDFVCEPVPTPLIVGKLVDILALPLESEDKATILGMDGNGNLMKCIPGGVAPLAFQMPPPDMHWGTPMAFESTSLGLYVLDPVTNAVWIFWENDDFRERPTLFFDEQVPPMGDVIDLTLNREDLYLLHEDGHLTTCRFGYPTRCEDPAMITDLRYGNIRTPTIDGFGFQEIQLTNPPDSSIFLLEPSTPSIYRFTLRLNFHNQYRAQEPLAEGEATAFHISSGHQIFLAIGNQVYVAPLP